MWSVSVGRRPLVLWGSGGAKPHEEGPGGGTGEGGDEARDGEPCWRVHVRSRMVRRAFKRTGDARTGTEMDGMDV
eukprot:scaffold25_cov342-Pavlova_lutheri.AAC.59